MGIPFEAIGSTPRRASELDRDRAAIGLAAYLQTILEFSPHYIHEDLRDAVVDRINAVRAAQGLPHAANASRAPSTLTEAKAHLGAALIQTVPSDDQIIMDHVRAAHSLLGGRL